MTRANYFTEEKKIREHEATGGWAQVLQASQGSAPILGLPEYVRATWRNVMQGGQKEAMAAKDKPWATRPDVFTGHQHRVQYLSLHTVVAHTLQDSVSGCHTSRIASDVAPRLAGEGTV